ncbi:MAG: hypothetical protein IJV56_07285 [Neisseriaceae bacterium]|nr:hypothetical protein [Neisseriaceae bacterium]
MKTRCPACGAENSLDALIANEDARGVLALLYGVDMGLVHALVRYMGLFRSNSRALSWERMARLLGQIVPDIQAGAIRRNGQVFPAPISAWVWAVGQIMDARSSGCLKLPLTTHGYLYEVISRFKGDLMPIQQGVNPQAEQAKQTVKSKTMSALETLASLK